MKSLANSNWGTGALLALAVLGASTAASAQNARARHGEPGQVTESGTRATVDSGTGVININTATAEEFQRLPGIGPSKAEAILATRQRMGRFARVEDILRVRGIGRATLRRLQPMLRTDGTTTLAAAAAHPRSPRPTEGSRP